MTILARALPIDEWIPFDDVDRQHHRRVPAYVVIRDSLPVDDGGIRRGAEFTLEDIQYSVAVKSLSAGCVLYDTNRDKYFAIVYPCPMRYQGNTGNREVDIDKLIEMYESSLL